MTTKWQQGYLMMQFKEQVVYFNLEESGQELVLKREITDSFRKNFHFLDYGYNDVLSFDSSLYLLGFLTKHFKLTPFYNDFFIEGFHIETERRKPLIENHWLYYHQEEEFVQEYKTYYTGKHHIKIKSMSNGKEYNEIISIDLKYILKGENGDKIMMNYLNEVSKQFIMIAEKLDKNLNKIENDYHGNNGRI